MNKRLVVLVAVVAAFFLLAAISRLMMEAEKLAETSATREVPQATAKEGLDVKFVSETSPYMRSERGYTRGRKFTVLELSHPAACMGEK